MIKVTNSLLQETSVPRDRFVCLSGGLDSIAAMHLLWSLKKVKGGAIHINHKMIPEDDDIQKAVESFCEHFSIPLSVVSFDEIKDDSYSLHSKMSKEAYAREIRYNCLRLFQRRRKSESGRTATFITCHHLDDCVESYLMNCFKGSPEYLPIPPYNESVGLPVIRPLLTTTKDDFLQYAKNNDLLSWVFEDPMNCHLNLKRNFIRKKVLPLVSESYPGLRKVVFKKFNKRLTQYVHPIPFG